MLNHTKYVAISLGLNAGLNPGSNSGLKDSEDEAVKWGEEQLKKNMQCPAVAILTVTDVLERTQSPIHRRTLFRQAGEKTAADCGGVSKEFELSTKTNVNGFGDKREVLHILPPGSYTEDGTRDSV